MFEPDSIIIDRLHLRDAIVSGIGNYKEKTVIWKSVDILDIPVLMRLTRYYIAFVCYTIMKERSSAYDSMNFSCKIKHFT